MINPLARLLESDPKKRKVLKAANYNSIGLSVFIVFLGLAYLVPKSYMPDGSLFVIAGLLLIITSAIIEIRKLQHVGFEILLGVILLLNGVNQVFHFGIDILPAFIVVIGLAYLFSLLIDHSGNKAQQAAHKKL